MTQFTIRNLTPQDFEQVYEVAKKAWVYFYKDIYPKDFIENFVDKNYSKQAMQQHLGWVKENGAWSIVVEDSTNRNIIGFAFVGPYKEKLWRLWRMYLLPEFINQGIEEEIIKRAEQFLKSKGISRYITFVHKDDTYSLALYPRLGFKQVSEKDQRDVYGVSAEEEVGFVKVI